MKAALYVQVSPIRIKRLIDYYGKTEDEKRRMRRVVNALLKLVRHRRMTLASVEFR